MNDPYRVTVVCTGNICRSPMGERVLEDALSQAGLDSQVIVDSAGTRGWHEGERAHVNTMALLERVGLRTSHHAARELTRERYDDADLILLMDRGHRSDLELVGFTDGAPALMWRSFDPSSAARGELDVPDPWGHPMSAYDEVFEQLQAGVPAILDYIRTALEAR